MLILLRDAKWGPI